MLEESIDQDLKSVLNPGGLVDPNSDEKSKEQRRRER
jgi:hypothetical protein